MWGEQCNTCGGHENSIRFINQCQYCPTRICNMCKPNHESVCEETAKIKRRGQGPTVRPAAPPIDVPPVDPTPETDSLQELLNQAAENIVLTESAANSPLFGEGLPSSADLDAASEILAAQVAATDSLAMENIRNSSTTGGTLTANTIFIPDAHPIEIPSTTENEHGPSDPAEL